MRHFKYIIVFVFLFGTAANAATLQDTTSDAFGSCVTEEFLDSPGAFSKYSKMPRTCIPDACAEISAQEYFYEIVGRGGPPLHYDAFLRKQDKECPTDTPRARYTDEEVLEFVFGGGTVPPRKEVEPPNPVPIPATIYLLIGGFLPFARASLRDITLASVTKSCYVCQETYRRTS